jgi:hypothetical protein
MASHRVVVNGMVYEVEGGKVVKPRGNDALELEKCGCTGNGCEDIAIDFPGTGFVVRNIGKHRVRVGMQLEVDWDCGRWIHFDLHPGESRVALTGGYCCPYEASHY